MGIFIVSVSGTTSGEVWLAFYGEFYFLMTTTAFYCVPKAHAPEEDPTMTGSAARSGAPLAA
jgi:hypothetical protein